MSIPKTKRRNTKRNPVGSSERVSRRTIAEEIAAELLTAWTGDKGTRLVVEMPGKKYDAAGWCEESIVKVVMHHLKRGRQQNKMRPRG